jgi:hypothetical protein
MSLKNDEPAMVIVPVTTYKALSGVRASQKISALFYASFATFSIKIRNYIARATKRDYGISPVAVPLKQTRCPASGNNAEMSRGFP